MIRRNGPVYEFGPYRLDVGERRLSKGVRPLPLRTKVFDTLRVLVEHHGHLVRKDDLIVTVWPDTAVEETNLSHNVSEVRRVLGERSAVRQRYIETVSKVGYRFVAPVRKARLSAGVPSVLSLPWPVLDRPAAPFLTGQVTPMPSDGQRSAVRTAIDAAADRVLKTVLWVQSTRRPSSRAAELFDLAVALVRGEVIRDRDGFAVTFEGVERAIRCAAVLISSDAARSAGLKGGIHTGECERLDGCFGGAPFRMAAALAAAACEGEVVVSRTVKDLVSGSGVQFCRRGRRSIPGLSGRWDTYAAVVPGP